MVDEFDIKVVFKLQGKTVPEIGANKQTTFIFHEIRNIFMGYELGFKSLKAKDKDVSCQLLRDNPVYDTSDITVLFPELKIYILIFEFILIGNTTKAFVEIVEDEKEKFTTKNDDKISTVELEIADRIRKYIFNIIFLSQISRPGSLELSRGDIYINGSHHYKQIPGSSHLTRMFNNTKFTYPKIEFIDFEDYYNWIKKKNIEICNIEETQENCIYQRALNIWSYVNGDVDEIRQLIYIMMGLELIYTDRKNEIIYQLNNRVQILLGQLEMNKKLIKNMYNIRSKFLHGSIAVNPYIEDYETTEAPQYEKELSKSLVFGFLIYVATLQQMYKLNTTELQFIEELN